MAAGLATPQDVRLNEPGPICQDSKKRRSFAGEYACLGMRSLRVRFGKSTHLGINSGTKTEVSHGECEDQRASPDCLSTRPGVSCRGEVVGPQRASQAEAPSVGYLGFRARISCSRCTFCEKKQDTYRISGGYRSILAYWSSCRAGLLTSLAAQQHVHLNRQEGTRRKSSTSQRRAR